MSATIAPGAPGVHGNVEARFPLSMGRRSRRAPSRISALCARLRKPDGKLLTCLGIDIQTMRGAPAGERLRIDQRLDDAEPLPLEVTLGLVRALAPRVVALGESFRIDHDGATGRVTLTVEPRDADDAQGAPVSESGVDHDHPL